MSYQSGLTTTQKNSFNSFLLDTTGRALTALEAMLGVSIDSSDSSIDFALASESENLKHVGRGGLYTISSKLKGDMQGDVLLLMRAEDFDHLSEVMRPIMSLMFLSSPGVDLGVLEKQKPGWMKNDGEGNNGFAAYHEQMLDTLAEMGNLLIGLYSKGLYRISDVNTHHTVPRVARDPGQQAIKKIMSCAQAAEQLHLVIENEFVMMGEPVKLWCLISPTKESVQHILGMIEKHGEDKKPPFAGHDQKDSKHSTFTRLFARLRSNG